LIADKNSRAKLVVGRKWSLDQIYALVTHEGIELSVDLEVFIGAVVEALGSPAFVMTKKGLKKRIKAILPHVLEEIKKASVEVV
jgi:hypothetical protein